MENVAKVMEPKEEQDIPVLNQDDRQHVLSGESGNVGSELVLSPGIQENESVYHQLKDVNEEQNVLPSSSLRQDCDEESVEQVLGMVEINAEDWKRKASREMNPDLLKRSCDQTKKNIEEPRRRLCQKSRNK